MSRAYLQARKPMASATQAWRSQILFGTPLVRWLQLPSMRSRCLQLHLVAVGTTITDRPPHRSVRARLRIRLLPRMNGVEALVGIRMQNTWVRNPPVEQWVETVPSHLRALAAAN